MSMMTSLRLCKRRRFLQAVSKIFFDSNEARDALWGITVEVQNVT
jgi:hypothetical protein